MPAATGRRWAASRSTSSPSPDQARGQDRQADGILFASYATLRSGTGEKTRLQQLLNG
jgi:hypothetical protein